MLNKIGTVLKKIGIVIGVFIILLLFYVYAGSAKPNTEIDYFVKINQETSLLDVTMKIKPNRFLFLDLVINNPRNKNGSSRISDFSVIRGDKNLPHWKTTPSSSSLKRLWVGFSKKTITVTYTVDPNVAFGNRGKMISYLTEDYGYLRGMNALYEPMSFKQVMSYIVSKEESNSSSGIGAVRFDLPKGWEINDPWLENSEKVLIKDLANTYWAFGKDIKITRFKKLAIGIIDKMDPKKEKALAENIKKIYEEIENLTGFQPEQDASYWTINILPPVPIHGGASGSYSLLTENNISTISHEIFHWWNGFTLNSDKKTKWIKEGFTRYYEGKILLNIGLQSDDEFKKFLERRKEELFKEVLPRPINLINVSKNYNASNNSIKEHYKLYNGGALLAYYIDKELEEEQRSLDDVWLQLYKLNKTISSEDFLNILEDMTDKTFRDEIEDIINGEILIPLE